MIQSRLAALVYGFWLPYRSFTLILKRPKLLFWSALPVALTLSLYFIVILRAQKWIENWVAASMETHHIDWGPAFHWALFFVLKVLLVLASALSFSAISALIASPFNDFLAEAAEKSTEPLLEPPPHRNLPERTGLLLLDLGRSLIAGIALLIAIALSWVPIVNVIGFAAAFLLVTFQYLSYPQVRRGEGILKSAWFLTRYPFASIAFGASLTLLFSIPILSSFAIPLAVVGGTQLYARSKAPKNSGFLALK